MAYRFHETFDVQATSGSPETGLSRRWTTVSGTFTASAGTISGYRCLLGSSTTLAKVIDSVTAPTELFFGFEYERTTLGGTYAILSFLDSAAAITHCGLGINASGQLFAFRSTTATVLATMTQGLSIGVKYWIEGRVKIDDTTGVFEVRLNGNTSPVINFSGDTRNGGTNAIISDVRFTTVANTNYYIDDFFCHSSDGAAPNGFLGHKHFQTLFPNGAGTYTQWDVTGAASNYQAVDEVPPDDDTSYVSTAVASEKDSYTAANLSGTVTGISYVAVGALMRKDGAGTEQARTLLISDSSGTPTESAGATQTLSTSYVYYWDVYTTNPDDSAAWEQADVNDIQVGVESIT